MYFQWTALFSASPDDVWLIVAEIMFAVRRFGVKAPLVGYMPAQFHTLLPCQCSDLMVELNQSYEHRLYIWPLDCKCSAFRGCAAHCHGCPPTPAASDTALKEKKKNTESKGRLFEGSLTSLVKELFALEDSIVFLDTGRKRGMKLLG